MPTEEIKGHWIEDKITYLEIDNQGVPSIDGMKIPDTPLGRARLAHVKEQIERNNPYYQLKRID